MAKATVIESTTAGNNGKGGVRQATRNVDNFVVYRHKVASVRPGIVSAAMVFLANKNNFTYSHSGNPFKGKSNITAATIASTKGAICCTALCSTSIACAQGFKISLKYNQTPDNFKKVGSAAKVALEAGDILCRNPSGSYGGHWMVYVGKDAHVDNIISIRLRYPEFTNNYYFNKASNALAGTAFGPPSIYHNCTWYAYGRFNEIAGKTNRLPAGDAGTWYDTYTGLKGSTPKVGAIAVYSTHVGIVEKIFNNGDILLSNSAFDLSTNGSDYGKNEAGSRKPKKKYAEYKHRADESDNYSYPYFYTKRLEKEKNWAYPECGELIGFCYQDRSYSSDGSEAIGTLYVALDMQAGAQRLKTSENYQWLYGEDDPELKAAGKSIFGYDDFARDRTTALQDYIHEYVDKVNENGMTLRAIPDDIYSFADKSTSSSEKRLAARYSRVFTSPGEFALSDALVQAPFVELDFGNGIIIGSYMASEDAFPNHVARMSVEKVNGEINQYSFSIIHQIRPGEDPNVMDKMLSSLRYDKFTIRYGDAAARYLYKDDNAVLTSVVMDRDYVSSSISYTLYATSACKFIDSYKLDFPAVFDKPSNQILKLLYEDTRTSKLMQEAFPGMVNRSEVESKNYIPTGDHAIYLSAQNAVSPLERLNYLVTAMSMASRLSGDISGMFTAAAGSGLAAAANEVIRSTVTDIGTKAGSLIGGAAGAIVGRNVGEAAGKLIGGTVQKVGTTLFTALGATGIAAGNLIGSVLNKASEVISYFLVQEDDFFYIRGVRNNTYYGDALVPITNTIFNVTVGYPGDECVMDFKVTNDSSWSTLLNLGTVSSEYVYAINRDGVTTQMRSPSLTSSNRPMNIAETAWWEFMTTFPISATLKVKGLLRPTKLMDYVNINVNFYGQPHVTSGLYVIIAQQDILDENGFVTQLTLLRVENE